MQNPERSISLKDKIIQVLMVFSPWFFMGFKASSNKYQLYITNVLRGNSKINKISFYSSFSI